MEEKKEIDYRKVYANKYRNENIIKELWPKTRAVPGIYCFYRIDQEGFKHAYIGLASKSLLYRMAQHLSGFDTHIDKSIRKYGLYNYVLDKSKQPKWIKKDNEFGYKCCVMCECPEEQVNQKEKDYIKYMADKGWQLKNVTSGSQDSSKCGLDINRPSKGYHEGLAKGRANLQKDLNYIIEKYLVITTKKDNVSHQKALNKFYMLLKEPEKPEEESQE